MVEVTKRMDAITRSLCCVRWTPRRIWAFLIILFASIVLCTLCIAIPILVIRQHRQSNWHQQIQELSTNNHKWLSECRDAIAHGITATSTLEGMVMGELTSVPVWNASVSDRLEGQSFRSFEAVANTTMAPFEPEMSILFTAPGGVIGQTWPPLPFLEGMDLFASNGILARSDPSPIETMETSYIGIIGPALINHAHNTGDEFYVQVRNPIYNIANISDHAVENFWGFTNALIDVKVLSTNNEYTEYLERRSIDYVMFSYRTSSSSEGVDQPGHAPSNLFLRHDEAVPKYPEGQLVEGSTNTASNGGVERSFDVEDIEVITSSLSSRATPADLQNLLETSTLYTIYPYNHGWYFAVRDISHPSYIPHITALEIIIVALAACFLFALLTMMLVVRCTSEYDGAYNAPRTAPFALLTVGPSQADELWAMASDQMLTCLEQLNATLSQKMKKHRTYVIPTQLWPFTTTYVFPTAESAVRMAFDVIEELQRNPPDERLRELLGEDERLLMTYAVHWCTDATVTEDKVEDALLYAGPDVAYAGRMWVFSSPNIVTLSTAATLSIAESEGSDAWVIAPLSSMYLLGVDGRQDLFTIKDRNSELLRAAHAAGARGVARWQAQLRRTSGPLMELMSIRSPGESRQLDEDIIVELRSRSTSSASVIGVVDPLYAQRMGSGFEPKRNPLLLRRRGAEEPPRRSILITSPLIETTAPDALEKDWDAPLPRSPQHTERHNPLSTTFSEPSIFAVRDCSIVPTPTPEASTSSGMVVERRWPNPLDASLASISSGGSSTSSSGERLHLHQMPLFSPLLLGEPSVFVPSSGVLGSRHGSWRRGTGHRSSGRSPHLSARLSPPLTHEKLAAAGALCPSASYGGEEAPTSSCLLTGRVTDESSSEVPSLEQQISLHRLSIDLEVDRSLRAAFERQALTLPTSYDSVRILVFYFYTSYDLLFKPLTSQERTNLRRRLATAFGVPQRDLVVHLAACCAVRHIQHHSELIHAMWQEVRLAEH